MKTAIEKFERKNMAAFETLALIERQEKQLAKQKDELKRLLLEAMEKNGIASVDNDIIRINYIPASEGVQLDMKQLRAQEPELYHEIETKYNKRTMKRAHIRIAVK